MSGRTSRLSARSSLAWALNWARRDSRSSPRLPSSIWRNDESHAPPGAARAGARPALGPPPVAKSTLQRNRLPFFAGKRIPPPLVRAEIGREAAVGGGRALRRRAGAQLVQQRGGPGGDIQGFE